MSPGATDGVVVSWLGQAGFVLRAGGTTLVVDPYLSDSLATKYRGTRYPHVRLAEPPVAPGRLTDVDAVLCSHRHTDHMDPTTLSAMASASGCVFVVPAAWTEHVAGMGIRPDRIVAAEEGSPVVVGEATVHPVLAAHPEIERDGAGRSLYLGYVFAFGGITFYHSGDCVPYEGLPETISPLGIDVALLPVNGRSATRTANGVPGNFHPAEAVSLVRQVDARVFIPHHFGMFEFNTLDEDAWDSVLDDVPDDVIVVRPTIGRSYEVIDDD